MLTLTTQKAVRAQFWANHPDLPKRRTRGLYPCDTRCAFVDYIDALTRNGEISAKLATRITLD